MNKTTIRLLIAWINLTTDLLHHLFVKDRPADIPKLAERLRNIRDKLVNALEASI